MSASAVDWDEVIAQVGRRLPGARLVDVGGGGVCLEVRGEDPNGYTWLGVGPEDEPIFMPVYSSDFTPYEPSRQASLELGFAGGFRYREVLTADGADREELWCTPCGCAAHGACGEPERISDPTSPDAIAEALIRVALRLEQQGCSERIE